ncbi:MAG: hypothetical protein OXC19_25260 [Bryobacterales bacterium]|nr:hypothetical protein [Bryobacterales bacterium]
MGSLGGGAALDEVGAEGFVAADGRSGGLEEDDVVADKGYNSDAVLVGLAAAGQEAHIPEPKRAERDFKGRPEVQRAVEGHRERVDSAEGQQLQKLLTEKVERSMAHMYETGAAAAAPARAGEPPQAPTGACQRVQPGGADEIRHWDRHVSDSVRTWPALG